MAALTGGLLVAAGLLVLAGLPKVRRPEPTVVALRSVGLRFVTRAHVRVLALAEITIGIGAILAGGPVWDALVAATYAAFSVFLVRALRSSAEGVSCGCTGRADTPPTTAHLVLTVVLAACSAAAALAGGSTGVLELDGAASAPALLTVGFTLIGIWFGWVVLHELADLRAAREHARN